MKTMKYTLIYIILILFIGCKYYNPPILLKPLNLDTYLQWSVDDLKRFIDSTYTDSTDLSSLLTTKCINNKGTIKEIDFNQGIYLYNSLIQSDISNVYPIFEYNKSPLSILIIKGKGQWGNIWAKILINKESHEIIKLEFDHRSETPGLGGNFTESIFENQFLNKKIVFDKDLFTLKNKANNLKPGINHIDGLSGATITCDSAVNMVNNKIIIYKKYLQ